MISELALSAVQLSTTHKVACIAIVTIGLLIYKLVIYPFYVSPLKDIPGPYLHRISYIPSYNAQRIFAWTKIVHQLHEKYGEVVVLSPTLVSCNGDHKYVHDIYVKNMPKTTFYENYRNHGFRDNIFSLLENDRHRNYKKMVQNLYLKSAVFSPKNATRANIVANVKTLVNQIYLSSVSGQEPDLINARLELNEFGKGHKLGSGDWFKGLKGQRGLGIDVYSLFGSLAMDVVSAFELGEKNATDLLSHPEKRHILVPHRLQSSMVFWTTTMPRFWEWAAGSVILAASETIEEWQLNLYARAEKNVPEKLPLVNLTTLETLKKNGLKGKNAYSFITDNIFAGHETTAVTMTYMCYELSRPCNLHRQRRLREELVQAFGRPSSLEDCIESFEKVDQLPFLEALMQENQRIHAAIPGAEPRMTAEPYTVMADGKKSVLPPGTGISCQPYLMHRVESVFPEPNLWTPERWLQKEGETEEEYKSRTLNMQRYIMTFGKGIRMCLGMQVALIEMKLALANLYWRFSLSLCEDWCSIEQAKGADIEMNSTPIDNGVDNEMMTMVDSYTTRPLYDECWLCWTDE